MPLLRTAVSDVKDRNGKKTAVVNVRAASKFTAILLARARAATVVPPREQAVFHIESSSQGRFFDSWTVEIQDKGELDRALP